MDVLVTTFKNTVLAECPQMIKNNDTESMYDVSTLWWRLLFTLLSSTISFSELQLMFRLIDRVPGGIEPMLSYLETHITNTGLADMIAAANIITQVYFLYWFM